VAVLPEHAPALAAALDRAVPARDSADGLGGYVVIEAAPAALKSRLPVWGQAPPAVDLMRRLRAQYDPKGIMVPGRLGWLS
jgi:glycolate oxidase FAD binding subunit